MIPDRVDINLLGTQVIEMTTVPAFNFASMMSHEMDADCRNKGSAKSHRS